MSTQEIEETPKTEFHFIKEVDCKQGAVRSVRFSVDGSYCLTCGSDRKLKLWNPYRSVLLKTYGGHGDEVMDASPSCDSSQLISCGSDKSVILWDVATGSPVRRLRGHAGPVTTVRFNEESSMAVSGSRDNAVMCWDIRSKSFEPTQVLKEAKDSISSVRVSDHEILSGSFDGRIRRYDIRVGEVLTDYIGDAVTCASFTRDGQCIVVSCADGVIRLMDKDSGELLGEFTGHSADNLCLESSIDCQDVYIISCSGDGKLWVWELATQKVFAKLTGLDPSKHPTVSLSVHPQRNCILATSGTKLLMWDTVNCSID
ncbi:WD repeat domain-containing protein 83 [Orussus abietinus]|uniref:WD repeat domain-containing protein 83 n=1 Tax=Orussus abietinus TaxID=222816 RepID=UPI0006254BFA|nr:WD repeat domain-containing protein 83 [Orussus abietinus]XP_012280433.1 WD repeat domain-containing protein 83 [Orussus abietinus]XP_012280434.1 WD repeat domain-containing protein 83 [Orussus abietinus]